MRKILFGLVTTATLLVNAGPESSRPLGFRFFNNHLTIKPYVSLSYTYDSNIDSDRNKQNGDSIFAVNPGVDFDWIGDRWEIAGNAWYRWNGYCQNNGRMGANSFGESLAFKYATAETKGQRGWTLMLSERYTFTSQSDSLNSNGGRGIWRDRDNFDANFLIERRFTEKSHADITGQYNYLNYHNDTGNYAPLYGWHRLSGGFDIGYVFSKWTDAILALGYSYYNQHAGTHTYNLSRNYSHNMQSFSVMTGLGTHLTDKISYRLLGGYSWANYGNACDMGGFTYSISANWRITRQFQTSLLGSSYYQPSESARGNASKVYTLSWGASYLFGDKLTVTGDVAFRYHQSVYADRVNDLAGWGNYDEDFLSFRLGANYTINRWVSVFASLAYDMVWYDTQVNRDYDRIRGTLGLRFHY